MSTEPVAEHALPTDARSELRDGWKILAGGVLGLAIGAVAIPTAALSTAMPALQQELGASRTELAFTFTLFVIVIVVTSPVVGWLADRFSELRIAIVSLLGMAASLLMISQIEADIKLFLAGFAAMAFVSTGASTVPFARIINAHFNRNRGLALGISMTGTGLASFILPPLLMPIVQQHGWRTAFMALAAGVVLLVPLLIWLLKDAGRAIRANDAEGESVEGVTLAEALRQRTFWMLAISFTLIAFAAAGLSIHFIALLTDVGLTPQAAAGMASIIGIATIVVRLATGWLIDRIFAPYVSAAMMALASLCLALLAGWGGAAAAFGAIAYGLAIGSEVDLVGFFTARYFGMRAYGRIYALLYAGIMSGSALSTLAYGAAFDLTHSYKLALFGASALLAVSAMLLLTLPRFGSVPQTMEH